MEPQVCTKFQYSREYLRKWILRNSFVFFSIGQFNANNRKPEVRPKFALLTTLAETFYILPQQPKKLVKEKP